ncbi:MAG: FAD-binding oxidoreductase [Rhodovarius sp.]|nr:FAD-binding oxidoreductase [Rhodovarius sp.]
MSAIDVFARMLGPQHVLADPAETLPYGTDWRGSPARAPLLVVRPGTTAEVAAVLRAAGELGLAVIPAGGRTGLAGGIVPLPGERPTLTLSLERMRRIRLLDAADMSLIAEAGCTVEAIQTAAAEAGRFFPLAFGAQGSAMLGGALSTNAGGIRALRYGSARDLVLGLEVVLPDGRVLDDLRRVRKDNSGYALRHLFIGAEGTLGVITAASLRLFPPLARRETAFLGLPGPQAALALFARVQQAGGELVAFELLNRRVVELTLRHGSRLRAPVPIEAPWYGMVEIASTHAGAVLRPAFEEALAAALEAGEASAAMLAENEESRAMLWRLRESTPECTRHAGPAVGTDTAVPVSALPGFLQAVAEEAAERWPEGRLLALGHLGDGNMHLALQAPGPEVPRAVWQERAGGFEEMVNHLAVAAGGSFSAEHGIGLSKLGPMAAMKDPVALSLMRAIKQAIDPAGMMNPGKVLPAR